MSKYNDIDLKQWLDYKDISTDTLWIIDKRDNSGAHSGHYHGNFVPQIAHQLLSRYTKKGDWVLDPFAGSGTSLIEAQRMYRNSIGIELLEDVAKEANTRIASEKNLYCYSRVLHGDSRDYEIGSIVEKLGIKAFQFMFFHPPYWDIIKFSDKPEDLSNCSSFDSFMEALKDVVLNTTAYLEKGRYMGLVIGDKYQNSQVFPLGFYCMQMFMDCGFLLKAIIVKNIGDTKAKSNLHGIWRYRAIASDFYIFRHEYIFVFKKIRQ